jgi:aconitate decarboxylase
MVVFLQCLARAQKEARDVIWELVEEREFVQHSEFRRCSPSERPFISAMAVRSPFLTLEAPKGVDPPRSNEDIVDKYRAFTKGLSIAERRNAIEDMVLTLEKLEVNPQLEAVLVDLTHSPFREIGQYA